MQAKTVHLILEFVFILFGILPASCGRGHALHSGPGAAFAALPTSRGAVRGLRAHQGSNGVRCPPQLVEGNSVATQTN